MNLSLKIFCLFIALGCFAVATIWSPPRGNLVAAGAFFATAAFTFG